MRTKQNKKSSEMLREGYNSLFTAIFRIFSTILPTALPKRENTRFKIMKKKKTKMFARKAHWIHKFSFKKISIITFPLFLFHYTAQTRNVFMPDCASMCVCVFIHKQMHNGEWLEYMCCFGRFSVHFFYGFFTSFTTPFSMRYTNQ